MADWDRVCEGVEARKRESGLLETRVTALVNATTDELWEALTTPESYRKLMPDTKESRHIGEKKGRLYCYQRVSGGPVSDRDYTLLVKWKQEGKTYHRTWTIANDQGPAPAKGVVRVEVHDGSWTLTPEGKKTKFEQVNYIELGGSLWAIVANKAVLDAARNLLESLKKAYP